MATCSFRLPVAGAEGCSVSPCSLFSLLLHAATARAMSDYSVKCRASMCSSGLYRPSPRTTRVLCWCEPNAAEAYTMSGACTHCAAHHLHGLAGGAGGSIRERQDGVLRESPRLHARHPLRRMLWMHFSQHCRWPVADSCASLQAVLSCQWTTTTTPAVSSTATLMVRRPLSENLTESDGCILWYACSTDRPA